MTIPVPPVPPEVARTALLDAADFIEQNPDRYSFISNDPPDCGTPGCMLGWTGMFLTREKHPAKFTAEGTFVDVTARKLGLDGLDDFLNLLGDIFTQRRVANLPALHYSSVGGEESAANAATLLRIIADRLFPAPETRMPDWNAMLQRLAEAPAIPA